jgi:hypothetical protein
MSLTQSNGKAISVKWFGYYDGRGTIAVVLLDYYCSMLGLLLSDIFYIIYDPV